MILDRSNYLESKAYNPEPDVKQYLRQDGGHWLFTSVASLDRRITLPSIQCELSLTEVYDKVDLV